MKKRNSIVSNFVKSLDRFAKYKKNQKIFVTYILILAFFIILFPVVRMKWFDSSNSYSVRLISGTYFKTMVIVFLSLFGLVARNISFSFKNLCINNLWFKNNDNLINFSLLWIMVTAFFSISDTLSITSSFTSTVSMTIRGKLIQLMLFFGLIFILISIIKSAKQNQHKTKIINMTEDHIEKHKESKEKLKWLFWEE